MKVKRIVSIIVAIATATTMFAVPVSANTGSNVKVLTPNETLSFNGTNQGIVLPDGEIAEVYAYKEGEIRIAEVTEPDGSVNVIKFDDATGDIFVNGKNIVKTTEIIEPEAGVNTRDNWGPVSTTRRTAWVEGMTAAAITIVITGLSSQFAGIAASLAGLVVNQGLSVLYYQALTQYNYVDWAPRVGYRLTEELYSSSSYSASSRLTSRTMTGQR